MKRYLTTLVIAGVTLFGLTACDGIRSQCSDGIDNDQDGLVDGEDPGCQSVTERSTARSANCSQDQSGLRATNPACQVSTAGSLESNDPECFDGEDNDGDGFIDFPNDIGCSSVRDGAEANPQCSDGVDNDGDALIDFPADPGCSSTSDLSEGNDPHCGDGLDNDGDGMIDFPADLGCASLTDTNETNQACSDGIDNDLDGQTDCPNTAG